ncbi:hypothetical protein [Massilia aerilata]|uniref:Uncharacterized protein n=1 Tax=Massilia aerilata TaxID=453817 RepID=A0ABW0RUM7_9BURK
MQRKTLKKQAVVFGSFNFPPAPDTTLKLLQIFASAGFLPQMINMVDPVSGMNSQKFSLVRENYFQMHFGSDRIDIFSLDPNDKSDLSSFISETVSLLSRLEGGTLNFTRIALVLDYVLEGANPEQISHLSSRLLPQSTGPLLEWVARWVETRVRGAETYNVCFEANLAQGLHLVVNNQMLAVNGVKIMHDISTSQAHISTRFNIGNLQDSFNAIIEMIEQEKSLVHFE